MSSRTLCRNRLHHATRLAVAGLAIFAGTSAIAAEQAALEEITVTARQIKESLQDVPVAVTAIGAEQLERTFVQDLRDVGAYAPNVQIGTVPGFNAASIAIRGVSTGDIPSTFDPAVSVVVDGFYLGHYQAALLDIFDLEGIEILRGPQGTLFGKNTIGGVINVTSKRPSQDFGIEAKVRAGNYGRRDLMGAINVPLLADVLAMRLTAQSFQSDGFYRNLADGGKDFGGQDLIAGRAKFLWTPTENFDALLSFEWSRDRSDTPPVINTSTANDPNGFYGADALFLPGIIPLCCRGPAGGSSLGNPFDTAQLPISQHVPGLAEQKDTKGHWEDIQGVYLTSNWRIGTGELTGILGYREVDSDYYNDYIASTIAGYATIRSVYRDTSSLELRWAQDVGEKFKYVAGAYYQDNSLDYENATGLGALLGGPACLCNNTVITSPDGTRSAGLGGAGSQTTKAKALFAEGNYFLTEKLRFTLGARWSDEEKDFSFRPISAALALAADNDALISVENSDSWSEVTYRAGIDYRFSPEVLAYLTYSTGFKSGGFNEQATSLRTAALAFDPEKADSVEVGVKSELFDRRLRLNVAAFHVKYEDLQLDSVVPVEGTPPQESVITNAGSSTSYGLEVEARAIVTDKLSLDLTAGYLHAEYDEYECDLDRDPDTEFQDCSILEVKRTPKFNGSLGATYEVPVTGQGSIAFNYNITYTDRFFNDIFDSRASQHDAVGLQNASATWTSDDEVFRVALFGRNLANRQYQAAGLGVANLWSFSTYGAPRTYGLEAQVNFK